MEKSDVGLEASAEQMLVTPRHGTETAEKISETPLIHSLSH